MKWTNFICFFFCFVCCSNFWMGRGKLDGKEHSVTGEPLWGMSCYSFPLCLSGVFRIVGRKNVLIKWIFNKGKVSTFSSQKKCSFNEWREFSNLLFMLEIKAQFTLKLTRAFASRKKKNHYQDKEAKISIHSAWNGCLEGGTNSRAFVRFYQNQVKKSYLKWKDNRNDARERQVAWHVAKSARQGKSREMGFEGIGARECKWVDFFFKVGQSFHVPYTSSGEISGNVVAEKFKF